MGCICESSKNENEGKPYFNAPIVEEDYKKIEVNQEINKPLGVSVNNNFQEPLEDNKPNLIKYKANYINKSGAFRSVAGATLKELDTFGNSINPTLNKPSKIYDNNNSLNANLNANGEQPLDAESDESEKEMIVDGKIKEDYSNSDDKELNLNESAKINGLYESIKNNNKKSNNQTYNNYKESIINGIKENDQLNEQGFYKKNSKSVALKRNENF